MALLKLEELVSGTWQTKTSVEFQNGEIAILVGRNGAGKSTLLNSIAGITPIKSGTLLFKDRNVTGLDEMERKSLGIGLAPEGRHVFSRLTVKQNLLMGAFQRQDREIEKDLEWVTGVFPALREKWTSKANTLSGGQQTMLSVARCLMGRPTFLLLDEPALGLDPQNQWRLITGLRQIQQELRISSLISEQSGLFLTTFSNRILVMVGGEITFDGTLHAAISGQQLSRVMVVPDQGGTNSDA